MTTVISIKTAPSGWKDNPAYVYIGRPSIFGNPIHIGKKCHTCGRIHKDGGSTLKCYSQYFIRRLTEDKHFHDKVMELKDKILVCFCKPNPCHGDVIAAALNKEDLT
jgi:Domain of unknown function (DUF4326)